MTEEHINYMLSKIPRNKFAKVEELASWLLGYQVKKILFQQPQYLI